MKMIQRYIVAGILLLSFLRIDTSADNQTRPANPELTEKLNEAINDDNVNKVLEQLQGMTSEEINGLDHRGEAPIHKAALRSYYKIMKLLINFGADINARVFKPDVKYLSEDSFIYPGATPLFLVARGFAGQNRHANIATFNMLVEQGADITAKNYYGCTLLHVLAMNYYNENWRIFMDAAINAGVDVNAQMYSSFDHPLQVGFPARGYSLGSTALHRVAKSKLPYSYELAKKLIDNGADRLIQDQNGNIPFECISYSNPQRALLYELLDPDYNEEDRKLFENTQSNKTA